MPMQADKALERLNIFTGLSGRSLLAFEKNTKILCHVLAQMITIVHYSLIHFHSGGLSHTY